MPVSRMKTMTAVEQVKPNVYQRWMYITVEPECIPAREDSHTDFISPEQTTYNEEFDLVNSSSLNFESFSYLPPEICCMFCPETKQQLTGAKGLLLFSPLTKCWLQIHVLLFGV